MSRRSEMVPHRCRADRIARLLTMACWLACLIVAAPGTCHAQAPNPPSAVALVRLAIVSASPGVSTMPDLLTAEFSSDERIQLLEREQINKVLGELALSTAANKDYLKLGSLLAADGLLVIEHTVKSGEDRLESRLVSVKTGVELGAVEYGLPLQEPLQWARLVAAQFKPLLPKLKVADADAVYISLLNLRSTIVSAESQSMERQLSLLLHDRLMNVRDVFVLERRRLDLVSEEKALQAEPEDALRSGSYLLEGVIDKEAYSSSKASIDVQLTPPGGKGPVNLSETGPRDRPAEIIDRLAEKILGAIRKGSTASSWDTKAEADRYFEEAQWMLKWQMYAEARDAVEAAHALGRQTTEAAELRVSANLGCAGSPGSRADWNGHVQFFRQARRVMSIGSFSYLVSSPAPDRMLDMVRAAELFVDDSRHSSQGTNAPDSSRLGLAIKVLNQGTDWLRYYYFNYEKRSGQEENISRLRQLCREISETASPWAEAENTDPKHEFLAAKADNLAFWNEEPRESLSEYQSIMESGQWPLVRVRFFNIVFGEIKLSSLGLRSHGFGTSPSPSADICNPCLAGWNLNIRRECPRLWTEFIEEECRSTNSGIRLEGLILRLSYAWSCEEFETNLAELMDHCTNHLEIADLAEAQRPLIPDLQAIIGWHAKGFPSNNFHHVEASFKDFTTQFKTMLDDRRKEIARVQKLKDSDKTIGDIRKYLDSQTRFDQQSFFWNITARRYGEHEARAVVPMLEEFERRVENPLTNVPPTNILEYGRARQELMSLQTSLHSVRFKLSVVLKESTPSTQPPGVPAAGVVMVRTNQPGQAMAGPRPFLPGRPPASVPGERAMKFPPGMQQIPPGARAPTGPPDFTKLPGYTNALEVTHFWPIPKQASAEPNGFGVDRPMIASFLYRDGGLWLEVLQSRLGLRGNIDLYRVDPHSLSSEHISSSHPGLISQFADTRRLFDVFDDFVYLWRQDSVSRYSLHTHSWDRFVEAGEGRPMRLGDRLFFGASHAILEYTTNSSLKILASNRRQPAISILDAVENYDPCHLFLDISNRVNACIGNDIYVLKSDSSDWVKAYSLPPAGWQESIFSEQGFLVKTMRGTGNIWGMHRSASGLENVFGGYDRTLALTMRSGMNNSNPQPPLWPFQAPGMCACIDGDYLWFVVAPQQGPGFRGAPNEPEELDRKVSLSRFKFGDPLPSGIWLSLSDPGWQDGDSTGRARQSRFRTGLFPPRDSRIECLPEGMVISLSGAGGFWFIPKTDLDEAFARQNQAAAAGNKTAENH